MCFYDFSCILSVGCSVLNTDFGRMRWNIAVTWYPEMLSPYPQCFSHFSYLFFEKWTLSSHTLLTACKGLPLYPCVAEEALHFTRYWSNSSKQFVQSYHSLLFSQCSCPNEVNIKLFFFSWRIRLYIFFTMFNEWIPSS